MWREDGEGKKMVLNRFGDPNRHINSFKHAVLKKIAADKKVRKAASAITYLLS